METNQLSLIIRLVSLMCVVVALPIVLLVRVLRPFVLIRFGSLTSQRIGHFAANTGLYISERDAGLFKRKSLDVFYHQSTISNSQLKKMWDRTLRVSPVARYLARANPWIPGGAAHIVPMNRYRDIDALYASSPPHLVFNHDEERRGQSGLDELGVPHESQFVCLLARDPGYLEATDLSSENGWSYQDYRDSAISNYLPAAEELARRGKWSIRLGADVKTALESPNPKIVDYANKNRSEFMDIFLAGRCYFFLGDSAGLCEVPRLFRRPNAWVNWIPLEDIHSYEDRGLVIPKHIWSQRGQRYMTFREIIQSGAGRFYQSEKYEEAGLIPVENTPEEITALALEMDDRLKGTWQTTEEDEDLQQRAWSFFPPNDLHRVIKTRIGAEFLRKNQYLLD